MICNCKTNIGTVSKAVLVKLLRGGEECIRAFLYAYIYHLELIINFNIRRPEQCLTKQPGETENDHQGD